MQTVLGSQLYLHRQSQWCRGVNLSPWEIWVLIISGKCCAEADNFVTPARCAEKLHWAVQGKHFIHVWIPRLFAASQGSGVIQGRAVSHGCFPVEMPPALFWYMGDVYFCENTPWAVEFLFFFFLFFSFFFPFSFFFFSFKWMKTIKITIKITTLNPV